MLHQGKRIEAKDFRVIKDYGENETFFRLETDAGEIQLPKLQFQLDKPLPDTLSCRIKGYNGAIPILGHNMPRYVSEFYADGFQKGEEFEFRVVALPDSEKGFYRIGDENGLLFKLFENTSTLTKGQSVRCKFVTLDQNYFNLRRSDNDALFPMLTLRDIVRIAAIKGLSPQRLENLLKLTPEMDVALTELNMGRPTWVLTAIRAIKQAISRIFGHHIGTTTYDNLADSIKGYRRVLLYLLQGSGFLRNIKGNERIRLQNEITAQIEQLDVFRKALEIIANDGQRRFINDLLNNLKESGYIFHPVTQFSVMMILFRASPELVNSSLGSIFDTLMGWDLETWKTEPFRQAFVEQLEIYISDTRRSIDRILQPETPDDNERIEKVLTAIAIQNSLADKDDKIDINTNRSLFYRYLSMLRSTKADVLLYKSYLTLMGVNLPTDFTWTDIKEPTMMMTRASVDPPSIATLPDSPVYFVSGDIEVEVGRDGIAVSKLGEMSENIVPNGMLPWPENDITELPKGSDRPSLKVNASARAMNRAKMKQLDGHAEFWNEVEKALFVPENTKVETTSTRLTPDIDDVVRIVVDRVITNPNSSSTIEAFKCHTVDDHFVESNAILNADELVTYNLHGVTVGTFRYDNGEQMQFDARVIDIDDNDNLIVSLLDTTRLAIRDMACAGDECFCVITKDNGRSYSAISENGYGLYVNKDNDDLPPFHRGNIIKVSITGFVNDAVQSVVIDGPIDNYFLSNAKSLHNLLLNIAVDVPESENDDLAYDTEDLASSDMIREIINIMRYKAVSCSDNILMSFDYLSFARLLAIIVEDEEMATILKAHKEMLLLHEHYARNKTVYREDIERVMASAPTSNFVKRMGERLLIVAALAHSEENSTLWHIANNAITETDRELAQTVLSYNLLYEIDHDDPSAPAIKNAIAKKLNVYSEQRNLKYYGSESQYVEFKSSLVYPARKGRSGISLADPDAQEFEIMHIIAGFLNTTGGTLYIGVSDDHYERGLQDDLNFYKMDTSERNTKYRRSIRSIDNVVNHLQNLIDSAFNLGKIAGDYAKAAEDSESTKGVVMVKIEPCPHIVTLEGNIYVRHSSKTEPLTRKEEIDVFTHDREQLYKQLVQASASAIATQTPSADANVDESALAPTAAPQSAETAVATQAFSIATSRNRNNLLHEWQDTDNFVSPAFYIRFIDDGKYIVTNDEWSLDESNDHLVLAVSHAEADQYLLLVYEGECAVKIRMREFANKSRNQAASLFPGRKLVFASPVDAKGALYSMHANTKSALYERATPADKILSGSAATTPERIMEADCDSTVIYEIVRPDQISDFEQIMSTGMKRTQLGSLVKGATSVRTSIEEAIDNLNRKLQI